jgi:hypothetical protein
MGRSAHVGQIAGAHDGWVRILRFPIAAMTALALIVGAGLTLDPDPARAAAAAGMTTTQALPSEVILTGVTPHPGGLSVTWEAPSVETDGPVRAYCIVTYDGTTFGCGAVLPGDARQGSVAGLTNGTSYGVGVLAFSGSGGFVGSNSFDPVTPTLTSPPIGSSGPVASLGATSGKGFATLTWARPATDGGSPITGYSVIAVDHATGQLAAWRDVPADMRTASLSSLVGGRAYDTYVLPATALGFGTPTAPRSVTPSASSTIAPRGPTMSWVSVTQIEETVFLNWGPAVERGDALTHFNVVMIQHNSMKSWSASGPNARNSSFVVPDDGPAQVYVFAQSASGYGPIGDPVTVTPFHRTG